MDADLVLDGNALAGLLSEIFVAEVTTAGTRCDTCGAVEAVGALRAYVTGPGTVLRCVHCDAVLLRAARRADGWVVDLRGLSWLRLGLADDDGR